MLTPRRCQKTDDPNLTPSVRGEDGVRFGGSKKKDNRTPPQVPYLHSFPQRRRPMPKVYVGLDAGSSFCHLLALDSEKAVLADRKFSTSEKNLIAAVEDLRGEVHLHIEAGELAAWIRRILKPRVARVVVGHPQSSAWIAKDALKRDRLDAFKLADLLRMDRVHEVFYADEDHLTVFKQIVHHFDDLTEQQVRIKQKIKARFRVQGVIPQGRGVYTAAGRGEWLARVKSEAAREAIEQMYGLLDDTLKAQKRAERLMYQEGRRYPEIARFDEVPGVGPVGACRYLAYIQVPQRFSSKRKLWRYCRLGIADRSSDGKPLGRQRLDWNGNGRLKYMSQQAFGGAMKTKCDNMFKRAFRATLHRTQDSTHARLSTQRKIVAVLRAMWLSEGRYDDSKG